MRNQVAILFVLVLVIVVAALVQAQGDGRYRPPPTRASGGGGGDGRYRPSNTGRYGGGGDGRYVHKDVKYVHDDRPDGGYTGDADRYRPDKNRAGGGGGAGAGGGGGGAAATRPNGGAASRPGGGSNGGAAAAAAAAAARAAADAKARQAAAAAAAAAARPTGPRGTGTGEGKGGWRILQHVDKVDKDGYEYLYETENGILAEERGRIEQLTSDDGLRSTGFYQYTGDDGILYRVDYVADDNGFVPSAAHLPTPPPDPPHIARLLAYLAENAPKTPAKK